MKCGVCVNVCPVKPKLWLAQ
ncbi:hypothetical protein [Acetivibrio straminisolvens]|nr:hypothetical protein [Acetivibrio straminisolvens]